MNSAILLLSCRDQKGIVAKISDFIYRHKGNIEHADQHIDGTTLFMRIQWALDNFTIEDKNIAVALGPLSRAFKMESRLHFTKDLPRVAIFVSRHTHCLYDLLLRYQEGQFKCTVSLIVSNHPDALKIAEYFGIKFVHTGNEARILLELKKERIEVIALARYMRILSPVFVKRYKSSIINIHHSFLPAFAGGNPYEQAYARGVKLIGATSHYVTAKLDDGPIIEQNTVRISHRDSLDDLKRKGKDLEKLVLSRALRWHLERKILVYNNKTVVFD